VHLVGFFNKNISHTGI